MKALGRWVGVSLLALCTTSCSDQADEEESKVGTQAQAIDTGQDLVIRQVSRFPTPLVEIFNRGTSPVALSGLSIYYGGRAFPNVFLDPIVLPSVVLPAKRSFLVARDSRLPADLFAPTLDLLRGDQQGQVALVRSTASRVSFGCSWIPAAGGATCPAAAYAAMLDLLGWWDGQALEEADPAPAWMGAGLSDPTRLSLQRKANGTQDTNNNRDDFEVLPAAPRNMASCFGSLDDGNACTVDSCVAGEVVHTAVNPNDNNPCTADSCDPATGVKNVALPVPSDGNPCTLDQCNPLTGTPSYPQAPEGTSCGANKLCSHTGACESAPPPVQAPAQGTTTGTPISDSTGFIYAGPNKVQQGVPAGYIDPLHAGWLVGYVKTPAGNPIANVTVSVPSDPNLGSTVTRADGRFDMIVNGGVAYMLRFAKEQHLTADRNVYVGWQETAAVDDVALVTLDAKSKVVTSGSQTQQVVIGTQETVGGSRTAMLVVPKNTGVFVDNAATAKPSVTLRLTEYTRGADGLKSMPAPLAERTAYTYAVEISADEALSANQIDFKDSTTKATKTAYFYVDNFLNFPVGKPVPAGYYSRKLQTWIPSTSGKIIRILSVTGAVPEVDIDGSGQAATSATLEAQGFSSEELALLKTTYAKDAQLWRVPITHMTPWDYNWPIEPPPCEGAVCPTPPNPPSPPPPAPDCGRTGSDTPKAGSIIGCDSQSLGEEVPVPGTQFKLRYSSNRQPGSFGRKITIPITGGQVHSQTVSVEATVAVAGERITKTFAPVAPATALAPNLNWDLTWDGLDGFARKVVGAASARVTVKTSYRSSPYVMVPSFGSYLDPAFIRAVAARANYQVTKTWTTPLVAQLPDAGWALGGWTISEHHYFDPLTGTLHRGSGGTQSLRGVLSTFHRILGDGASESFAPDGASATAPNSGLKAGATGASAVASNGDVFVTDTHRDVIRRISAKTGTIATVIGHVRDPMNELPACSGNPPVGVGDGDDALLAQLKLPQNIALADDGSIYITSSGYSIRKATPKSTGGYKIETFAGTACTSGFSGDGGLATAARLSAPAGIAVGPDRSVYVADSYRIRRIGPDNVIQTIAGTGVDPSLAANGDGQPAAKVALYPSGLVVAPDGEIYIAGGFPNGAGASSRRLAKIDRGGVMRYLTPECGANPFANGVSLSTQCADPSFVALRRDGSILFDSKSSQSNTSRRFLREVDPLGLVTTLSGGPGQSFNIFGDGLAVADGPSPSAPIAVAPDGGVVFADNDARSVYAVERPEATTAQFCGTATYAVPSGDRLFCFDRSGRHQKTVDRRNGSSLLSFAYGSSGSLATITDSFGRATTITKANSPSHYLIAAPYGQSSSIALDAASGYATSINFNGGGVSMRPRTDGLLDSLTTTSHVRSDFTFTDGLLVSDVNVAFGEQTLVRTPVPGGWKVTHKTPLLRSTVLETLLDSSGTISHRTTFPNLSTETRSLTAAGLETVAAPDGTTTTIQSVLDPSVNPPQLAVGTRAVRLNSGLTFTIQQMREAPKAVAGVGLSQVSKAIFGPDAASPTTTTTQTYTADGANLPDAAAARRVVVESPEQIKRTRLLDKFGRTLQVSVGNLTPTKFAYETLSTSEDYGKLKSISQGERISSIDYQPKGTTPPRDAGYILRTTGPFGQSKFVRDAAGQAISMLEGEDSDVAATSAFAFDEDGSLRSVKPPSSKATPPEHVLEYRNGILIGYTPPSVTGVFDTKTTYGLDGDRAVATETGPKALSNSTPVTVTRTYVTASGEPDTVEFPANGVLYPAGKVDYDYHQATNSSGGARGRPSDVKGPYNVNFKLEYDSALLTKTTWSGDVVGSVARTYNSNFLLQKETLSPAPATGPASYAVAYDKDGALKCVSGAPTDPCNPSKATDLVLKRSLEHGMTTEITIGGPAVGSPPVSPLVVESIDYSDTAEDRPDAAFGELRQQLVKSGSVTLAKIVYDAPTERRDGWGRIKYKTETFANVTRAIEYAYDARGRLDFVQSGVLSEEFFYDLNGNRVGYTNTSGVSLVGSYDDQDRLLKYGTSGGITAGDATFAYTPNGELATKVVRMPSGSDTWTYGYDPLGNLVSVSRSSIATTYTYLVDGKGRRVGKKRKVGAAAESVQKRWLYRDGLNPVAELTGGDASSATLFARYIYGSRPNVPDLVVTNGKVYRLIVDQVGSPRMAVNVADASDVPFRVDYSAFGEPRVPPGFPNARIDWIPFGFAGGLYDPDTGLVRFGARDYDPSIGRWVSKDPIKFDGGQTNLYAYAHNDPVNLRDAPGTGSLACIGMMAACGLTSIYDLYDFKSDFDDCMEKAKDAQRDSDHCPSDVDSIRRRNRNIADVGFQCVADTFADHFLMEGVNGLICVGAMVACFGTPF